ncbi:hypothetical protein [Sediminibacillus massiliensis]|uniref:hypothetical protein n=1 Tax=Sediminibacillus massiliensis TaxID=1926277 RepID=UPI000988444A|nr:hypothetical protein [Sediminibacillus massiliensis]
MEVYCFYSDLIYEEENWQSKCIHVEDGRFVRSHKVNPVEMVVDGFWIGPGKVYVDMEEPVYFQANSKETVKSYIDRGCTLLLCQLPVYSSQHFKRKFYQFKEKLAYLPIDYMIVPRIPLPYLKTEQIRFFGRKRLPFIIVELATEKELWKVKWEWIQQAQSLSGIHLFFTMENNQAPDKHVLHAWKHVVDSFLISSSYEEISHLPLPKKLLRITGISPYKGELLPQGSADYNLFPIDKFPSIDEPEKFRYHKASPVVTVAGGKVVMANQQVEPEIGRGYYQKVSIPRHFL